MGWPVKKLKEVCRLINGRAYKKNEMLKEGPYPLLRVGNFFSNRNWYFSDLELDEDKYCDNGDLLYAWSASFGPRIWDGGKVIYHYHIWKIEVNKALIDKHFLYYLLEWDKELIKSEQGAGTTMIHVTKASMENREFPIPPVPEQKRIVTMLDEAFAAIEKARELTEQNLKNAGELFESYLHQVFTRGSNSWAEANLGEICEVSSGGTPKKSVSAYWQGDIPWYSSGELNHIYTSESKEKTTEIGIRESNAKIFPSGSLLIGMYDTAALKMSILDRDGAFNQAIAGVKPNDKVNLEFILYSIEIIKPKLLSLRRGVRQKNLNQSKIREIPLRIPDLQTQDEVVRKINSFRKEVDELLKKYRDKLDMLEILRRSLLEKLLNS